MIPLWAWAVGLLAVAWVVAVVWLAIAGHPIWAIALLFGSAWAARIGAEWLWQVGDWR